MINMEYAGSHASKMFNTCHLLETSIRVPTAQGKQGKWQKVFSVREDTGNLESLSKQRENTGNFVKKEGKHRESFLLK